MPLTLGMKIPTLLFALEDIGGEILPWDIRNIVYELRVADRHYVRNEWVEEPPLFNGFANIRVVMSQLPKFFSRFNAKFDASIPKHFSRFSLMNFCIHIQGREEWVEG